MTVDQTLIDRLGAAALDARAAVHELNEARAGLRADVREARTTMEELRKLCRTELETGIDRILNEQLETIGAQVVLCIQDSEKTVAKRFDELAEPLFKTLGLIKRYTEIKNRTGLGLEDDG